ncbi:MAG: hypothetical protein JSR59_20230 [Proteobacteria bacterium]|nr:hypothetical protein [Pseudomonadota bacterium]
MKRSRLLVQLDRDIAAARTPLEADCLRARQAVHFARLGQWKHMRPIVADLHRTYDARPNLTISIWLHLIEGLGIYYEDIGGMAIDKVRRAHALSVAAGIKPLHALTAAWLAQLLFIRNEVDQAATHLRDALRLAEPDDHATRSRAALVGAQAMRQAGSPGLDARWHRVAREHAVREGDDATTGALMHNAAWGVMDCWRQAVLTGRGNMEVPSLLMSVDSAGNFNALTGSSSLSALQPLMRAQILSLMGEAGAALALYEAHLSAGELIAAGSLQAYLYADQAWCCVRLDRPGAARAAAERAGAGLVAARIDDRASAHSRLAQVYARLGADELARDHAARAAEAWQAYAEFEARVAALFVPLLELSEAGLLTPPSAPAPRAHSAAPHRPATAP